MSDTYTAGIWEVAEWQRRRRRWQPRGWRGYVKRRGQVVWEGPLRRSAVEAWADADGQARRLAAEEVLDEIDCVAATFGLEPLGPWGVQAGGGRCTSHSS